MDTELYSIREKVQNTDIGWTHKVIGTAALVSLIHFTNSFLLSSPPASRLDAVFMQWVGWYTTVTDAALYRGIFDIQAPLAYLYPKLLYQMSLGNITLHHFLNVATTLAASVTTVYLTGRITYDYTDNSKAAMMASLVMLSLNQFTLFASIGFARKIFALMFGLLSIKLYENGHEKLSGISAVLSPAFWAFGVFFSITVFIKTLKNRRKRFPGFVLSSGTAIILVLTPLILEGVLDEMILEAIMVPLTISESKTLLQSIGQAIIKLRYPAAFMITGAIGSVIAAKDRKHWILAGFLIFSYQLFSIDFDSASDAFMLYGFASIATGILLNKIPEKPVRLNVNKALKKIQEKTGKETDLQQLLLLIPAAVIIINVGFGGGTGIIMDESYNVKDVLEDNQEKPLPLVPYIGQEAAKKLGYEMDTEGAKAQQSQETKLFKPEDYWNSSKPGTCHYRWGSSEAAWVEKYNINKTADRCGKYPEKYYPAIVEKLSQALQDNPNLPDKLGK